MKTYLPPHFVAPEAAVPGFMQAHPFALLIAVADGEPVVSHVPMRVLEDGQRLEFHLARANPQVAVLEQTGQATAVFHGPHAYVSPRWYAQPNVPTWNFAAVHVAGSVRALDAAGTAAVVAAFARDYEGPAGLGEFEESAAYAALLKGIVGFELVVEHQVAKFKLSQNRAPADRESVISALEANPHSEVREVAELMRGLEA
jgi:transcriptional regulator